MLSLETPLYLEAKGNGNTFISHAHSDHVVRSASKVLCSEETFALLKCRRYVKKTVEKIDVNGVKLLPAGHVLGSCQLLAEREHSFLYTGDFRPSPSLTSKAAQQVNCDELLVECTFGLPRYSFPTRVEVGQEIAKWASQNEKRGEISVIGGYSLGKAQEITAHLNEVGIATLVPEPIEQISKVYNSFGVKLDFISIKSSEGQEQLKKGFTAVFPLNKATLELKYILKQGYSREVRLAHCSGWTVDYKKLGIEGFPLSDHCNFNELLAFVKNTEAEKVYCVYGYANEFASILRHEGIDAVSLKEVSKNQQLLTAFASQ